MDAESALTVLIADDDADGLWTLGRFLRARGHRVLEAGGGREAVQRLESDRPEMVITDLKMPDVDGFAVLREARRLVPEAEVVMVTGYGDMQSAVTALREGAADFLTKPIDLEALAAAMARTEKLHAVRQEKDRYRDRLQALGDEGRETCGLTAIVGESAAIRALRRRIAEVAQANATTVLITGETGTGKELVARAIHYESRRASGPMVSVDCTSLPESLVESELYGHERGAFTDAREARKGRFEQADGGTLFLDEIGDMPMGTQARLLRVLEERTVQPLGSAREVPVDVRVVSATNRDLSRSVEQGSFRPDLYYRVNAVQIHVPPIRDRRGDIAVLAQHFAARCAREQRKPVQELTPEAVEALEAHGFPGNVRELRNLIEQAVIFSRDSALTPADVRPGRGPEPDTVSSQWPQPDGGSAGLEGRDDLCLSCLEQEAIEESLRRSGGKLQQASELLGISRYALKRRMERYGLTSQ